MGNRSSDQLLVERVKAGDKHAFDLLVLKYQHRIVKLIMRYVRDPAEELDVSQEAFLKAYRALPRFRGDSAFYTWMYRIATNEALVDPSSTAQLRFESSSSSARWALARVSDLVSTDFPVLK